MKALKILFVDISLRGHRIPYIKALAERNSTSVALLPEINDCIPCKQIVMQSGYDKKRNFGAYIKWIAEIRRLCKEENIDLVHFLCGDVLYRFFGIGLGSIACPIIVTYHHMQFSRVRNVSIKRIFKHSHKGIVHTEHLLQRLKRIGIENAQTINYPIFSSDLLINKNDAKNEFGLPQNIYSLVALGGTQRYKGLDILLEALKMVKYPFQLLIAGRAVDFDEDYIKEHTKDYAESVTYILRRVSDAEFSAAAAAADIVVLPYRFEFDGASGPMIEGIWNRKFIIGAEHGSMGNIIRTYNLGRTFKTEDSEDLAKVLDAVLSSKIEWSDEAENYRKTLTAEEFLDRYSSLYETIR